MKMISFTILLLMLVTICEAQQDNNYPTWPKDFKYSHQGPINGYECTKLTDKGPGWNDNYLCVKLSQGMLSPKFQWRQNVEDIDEVESEEEEEERYCINIAEPDDDVTGKDNYLCMSEDYPDEFEFITDGDLEEDSEDCIRIYEPSTPEWKNNFLCLAEVDERRVFGSRVLGTWHATQDRLKSITTGARTVWGIATDGQLILKRKITNENMGGQTGRISTDSHVLIDVSAGINNLFAVTNTGNILAREGISDEEEYGKSWKLLDKPAAPSQLRQISVSSYNDEVWATSTTNEVFYREGINDENQYGTNWVKVKGSLKKVSTGEAGVWGVTPTNKIVYRSDTADDYGKGNTVTEIALFGHHYRYVDVDDYGNLGNESPDIKGSKEIFQVSFLGEFKIALKSKYNRKYVSALTNGLLKADSDVIGAAQTFEVKPVDGDGKIALYSIFRKRYISVSSDANVVSATVGWMRDWEKIRLQITNGANFWTPLGEGWLPVAGEATDISSGYGVVWVANAGGQLYARLGINEDKPTGEMWKLIDGNAKLISSSSENGWLWVVNRWSVTYYRKPNFNYALGAGLEWISVPGKLLSISVGQSGVWGCNYQRQIFYRVKTYDGEDSYGTRWTRVSGTMQEVSSGIDIVWGINNNQVFVRDGISEENPTGTSWERINNSPAGMAVISVNSANNDVWGATNDKVYRRVGASLSNPKGTSWKEIPYAGSLKHVAVGHAGVWALDRFGNVKYREGTYDEESDGTSWKSVTGRLFKSIASGENLVIGTEASGHSYARTGINEDNPIGTSWVRVSIMGDLKVSLNSLEHQIWMVDRWANIRKRTAVYNEV